MSRGCLHVRARGGRVAERGTAMEGPRESAGEATEHLCRDIAPHVVADSTGLLVKQQGLCPSVLREGSVIAWAPITFGLRGRELGRVVGPLSFLPWCVSFLLIEIETNHKQTKSSLYSNCFPDH